MEFNHSGDWSFAILVDEHDNWLGIKEKLSVSQGGGHRHGAFFILIIDEMARALLQRRAKSRDHCPVLCGRTPENILG